jgi:succinate dehydrogenase flavin-adding protein (antitoxin of CptAB toxin-antitoxin module)
VSELDRIRWHCRRGLLELDLVLARFQEQALPGLSAEELEGFKRLLQCSDNDLWDLVSGRLEPAPGLEARLVERLRAL